MRARLWTSAAVAEVTTSASAISATVNDDVSRARVGCTERQPHRSLALPADRTCEEQVQDVGQRDRDHERDAREEDEECRLERRGEVVLKRRGVCAELRGVLRRELGAQPCGDAV